MRNDTVRPAYSLEPKYRVIILTREEWTKGSVSNLVVNGLIWFTEGGWGQSMGSPWLGGWASLGTCTAVFQAKICPVLACVYEIQLNVRSEEYISICSDSQATLKALKAAKGHWMRFSPTIQWDSYGSLDILVYVEMKLLMSLWGRVLFTRLNQSQPWRSQGRRSSVGSLTGTLHCGKVLPALRHRLNSWSRALTILLREGYCTLIGYNAGWLLAWLYVTSWEDACTWCDWLTVPYVGGAGQRKKQLMFCVSVKLCPHLDITLFLVLGPWGC
jgi:hypothetical protein